VTDYITKSVLATHVGLSTVKYAIKRNNQKFSGTNQAVESVDTIDRSLFTKTVMALMSKQEVSHQQVRSYLVGGRDYYTSHTSKPVKWGEIDRLIAKEEATLELAAEVGHSLNMALVQDDAEMLEIAPRPPAETGSLGIQECEDADTDGLPQAESESDQDEDSEQRCEEDVTLVVSENYVGVSIHSKDYPCRSREPAFDNLCLWEHEEWVTKASAASEEKRLDRAELIEAQKTIAEYDGGKDTRRGCRAEIQGALDKDHPQNTHVARFCRDPVVNMLLGETLPRPDRSPKERDRWAGAMLILFKPWQSAKDLKDPEETWTTAAYEKTTFSDSHCVQAGSRTAKF
jgi:hypothetical protein